MKLYDVPRNSRIRILTDKPIVPIAATELKKGDELNFHHIDGMYSYCVNDEETICHLRADTEVEVIIPLNDKK